MAPSWRDNLLRIPLFQEGFDELRCNPDIMFTNVPAEKSLPSVVPPTCVQFRWFLQVVRFARSSLTVSLIISDAVCPPHTHLSSPGICNLEPNFSSYQRLLLELVKPHIPT